MTSSARNPGIGRFISYIQICVNCGREATITLVEAETHGAQLHIRFFFVPCPCIALKKGITSELPSREGENV